MSSAPRLWTSFASDARLSAAPSLLTAQAERAPLNRTAAAALAFEAAGLALTAKAAPFMLGIAHESDPVALKAAFDGFYEWSAIRGACHVLGFAAEVWALGR